MRAVSRQLKVPLATTESPGAVPSWPQTVANNFDPSVSGLTGDVGLVVATLDSSKAWKKWGAAAGNWVPLHSTSGTTSTSVKVIDIPLYCDSAGGFRLELVALQSDVDIVADTGAHPAFQPRINGSVVSGAENLERFGGRTTGIVVAQDANLIGGTAVWFGNTDYGFMTAECSAVASSIGPRMVRFWGNHRISTNLISTHLDVFVPSGEITSVGISLVSVGSVANIPAGAAWRLERKP